MEFFSGNAREPDVFFVSNNHLANARETYLDGPANLVVEVVSDDSVNRDRVEKLDEYEATGKRGRVPFGCAAGFPVEGGLVVG